MDKFKVGEKVRVTGTRLLNGGVGNVGTITSSYGNNKYVVLVNGVEWYIDGRDLKLESELKIGDKFRVVDNTRPAHYYKIGEIVTLIEHPNFYKSKSGKTQFLNPNDLTPVGVEVKEPKLKSKVTIHKGSMSDFLVINDDITISIPSGIPVGISYKHPEDEFNLEMGQAIAFHRMVIDSKRRGLI